MKEKFNNLINKVIQNPIFKKAAHTFWQAYLSVFLLGSADVLNAFQDKGLGAGKTALLALIGAAIAAGFSALKTAYQDKK